MKHLGSYAGKYLYLRTAQSLNSQINWPSLTPYFKLVVFLDAEHATDNETLFRFAQMALDAGARYIFCAGTAGELLYDIFDEVIVLNEAIYTPNADDSVFTTWHDYESIADILWQAFLFTCTDRFEACNPPILVFTLSEDTRIAELERIGISLDATFQDLLY